MATHGCTLVRLPIRIVGVFPRRWLILFMLCLFQAIQIWGQIEAMYAVLVARRMVWFQRMGLWISIDPEEGRTVNELDGQCIRRALPSRCAEQRGENPSRCQQTAWPRTPNRHEASFMDENLPAFRRRHALQPEFRPHEEDVSADMWW